MPEFDPAELAEWSGGTWTPCPPERVVGVSNDTRTIEAGNLYFALQGERFDGHEFAGDAFAKGAAAAVVARERVDVVRGQRAGETPERCLLVVGDTREALMDTAAGYRLKIDPRMIGITGSVGKSTVKEMTARMFAARGPTAWTKGNWNNDVGLPLSILAMEESTTTGVFEVGTNHPGEIARLCDALRPSSGVVTNVGPVHMEHFDSVEAIAREKGALLACLPGDGFAVLDGGGEFLPLLRSMCDARVIKVGRERERDDYVCLRSDSAGGEFTVFEKVTGEEAALRNAVPGGHNITNALFAVAVARTCGIPWDDVREALAGYDPLPMRWQRSRVKWQKGADRGASAGPVVGIVNDAYNANPMSMRASVRAFAEQNSPGRKWLVLADMLELGAGAATEHAALGAFIARVFSEEPEMWGGLVATGDLGRAIVDGALAAGAPDSRVAWCRDKDDAYGVLSDRVSSGDDILLKASRGMRLEELLEGMEEEL